MKISTGFLTGNLLANAESGVNESATAQRFAEELASAIAAKYPETEVIVGWRRGSGFLPQEMWTAVNYDPGHREVDAINGIIGEVIRGGDFHVHGSADEETREAGAVRAGLPVDSPAPRKSRGGSGASRAPLFPDKVVEILRQWAGKKISHS